MKHKSFTKSEAQPLSQSATIQLSRANYIIAKIVIAHISVKAHGHKKKRHSRPCKLTPNLKPKHIVHLPKVPPSTAYLPGGHMGGPPQNMTKAIAVWSPLFPGNFRNIFLNCVTTPIDSIKQSLTSSTRRLFQNS